MKTYLVPIDFSHASLRAADFAAELSKQTNVEHIILLNAYYVSPYETMLPTPDMVQLREDEIEQNAAERVKNLEELKAKLIKKVRPGVEITTHLNRSHLVRAVVENVAAKHADLVILGSIGNTSKDDSQIGNHVVKISAASPVPVIVVPPAYHFENIERIVVACDFNQVKETIPLQGLKKLLDRKKVELLVVNVDREAKHIAGDAQRMAEETTLHKMLQEYHPQYYYINSPTIIAGILKFAVEKEAQMVIALPHKYSFFRSILHDSVSQQLAAAAAIPVLLLK